MLDAVLEASWDRVRQVKQKESEARLDTVGPARENQIASRTFTVRDALNGQYIEFRKFKYNPIGPNEYEECTYLVREDESIVDAIATVLVLMHKHPGD